MYVDNICHLILHLIFTINFGVSTGYRYTLSPKNNISSRFKLRDSNLVQNEKLKESDIIIRDNQNVHFINEELLSKAAQLYRSSLCLNDFQLDIFIEDGLEMRRLNYESFGEDSPTDIISTSNNSKYVKSQYYKNRLPSINDDRYHLGEIFLCPDYVQNQIDSVREFGETTCSKSTGGVAKRMAGVSDLNMRLCYLIAHGILHLLGYDHQNEDDFIEMTSKEDELLNTFIEYYNSKNH